MDHPLQVVPFAKECAAAFDQKQNSLSSILKTSAGFLSEFKDIREDKAWKESISSELEESPTTGESWTKAAEALSKQGPSVIPTLLKYLEIKDVGVQIGL